MSNKNAIEYAKGIIDMVADKLQLWEVEVTMAAFLQPTPAPRMTQADRWKKRPCVVRYLDFKTALRRAAASMGIATLPEVLNVIFVIPCPKSISKAERARRLYNYHKQKPDRDNMLKAVQDAFDGDDSHCADGRTIKLWGEKAAVIFYK